MKRQISLGRQLARAMVMLALAAVAVSTAVLYFLYAVLEKLRVIAPLPPGFSAFGGIDFAALVAGCLLAATLAVAIALRVARGIAQPLVAVGEAARRLATGDLATRVVPVSEAHGETALLIADFNAMADRLQRMSEDVKSWNAQIAHELRTPLTILRGRLQGAKDGIFPLDTTLINGLMKQVEGLTRVVEDLRSVSLAESGRLELAMLDFDLAAELVDLEPVLTAMLKPSGFDLCFELVSGMVRADPARVRQAVIALVDNACRHADPCVLRITLEIDENVATILVCDAGPGLSPDFAPDAFGQFTRAAFGQGGTGLGLAVVRSIARAHGGDATYTRFPRASAFVFSIPRGLAKPEPQ